MLTTCTEIACIDYAQSLPVQLGGEQHLIIWHATDRVEVTKVLMPPPACIDPVSSEEFKEKYALMLIESLTGNKVSWCGCGVGCVLHM